MRKRVFFVAVMAVLLISGMWSSAACEVTCAPPSPTGVCCPHSMQMRQASVDQCAHPTSKVVASQMVCSHPDDGGVTAINLTVQDFHPALSTYPMTDAAQSSISEAAAHTPAIAFPRRSSLTPLRI